MIIALTDQWVHPWSDMRVFLYRHTDKIGHFLVMLFFTQGSILVFRSVRVVWICVALVIFSAALELAQVFSERSADLIDFLAGAGGTLVITTAYYSNALRNAGSTKED